MKPYVTNEPIIKPRRISSALAACAALLLITGCGSPGNAPAPSPIAATGEALSAVNCGRKLSAPKPPINVLIGYPTLLKTLNALGVGDSVTGYLAGSLADLPEGSSSRIVEVSPDYHVPREKVLGVQPDLVITSSEDQLSGKNGEATFDDLASAGIPAFISQGNCADPTYKTNGSLQTVYDDIEALGNLFRKQTEAKELVQKLQGRVVEAAARRGNSAGPTVAFIQVYNDKLYALGLGNYAAVLEAIGAKNYFSSITSNSSFVELSMESALAIDADYLVVVYNDKQSSEQAIDSIRKLLPNAAPVAAGRISAVRADNFEVGGVPLIDVTAEVAEAVYR